jgi:hypothetical protein
MNSTLTPEQRKKRTELIVSSIGLFGLCLFLGPLVSTLVAGGMALAGLIAGGAAIFTVWKMLPWFAMKIGNLQLKAIKAEAMKNPVETLQNKLVEKQKALDTFKEQIRIFSGQIMTFGSQVAQYVKDGLEDAPLYMSQLEKMKQLLQLRQERYLEAKESLAEFQKTIERTDRKWKMACAAAAMNEAAGQIEGDVFDQICVETAVDSVQQKLNQSFADLELALLDDTKKKVPSQFSAQVTDVITSPTINSDRKKVAIQ